MTRAQLLELLREVAGLYETRINDKNKAFERFLSAFGIAPSDEQSQADVERAAQLTGRWDDLIGAYQSEIESADGEGDAMLANTLRLRLGRVLVDEVQRIDDALAEYRAVYESEPDNTVALEALERLYRDTERWRELLDGAGVKRAAVSGQGLFTDATTDASMRQTFFDGTIVNYQIVIPDFGTVAGLFQITDLAFAGQHNAEVTYDVTLESAGELTFTAM